jgi:hypothetical protein
LHTWTREDRRGQIQSSALNPNEALVDTRPVEDADVSMEAATVRTDATGTASLSVAARHVGTVTVRTTAGDTFVPTSTAVALAESDD